jgi:hypothetical protein
VVLDHGDVELARQSTIANADNSVVTTQTAGSGGVWITDAILGSTAISVRSPMPLLSARR